MAKASPNQTSFLGGEWSKKAQGRFDDPRYRVSMARALNIIPLEEHSAPRRPGFRHITTTRGGAAGRLLPWPFKPLYPYTLEFTDGHLRFFRGIDLVTDAAVPLTSISAATPAVLTMPAAPGWATDDRVKFVFATDAARAACPTLGNRVFSIVETSTTTFALHDGVTGVGLDGSALGAVTDITIARVHDIATVYTGNLWSSVQGIQSSVDGEEQLVLLQKTLAPQVLTVSTADNVAQPASFAIKPVTFKDGPYYDPFLGSWATSDALDGVVNLALSFQTYDATTAYALDEYVTYIGASWKSLVDESVGNTPAVGSAYWTSASPGDVVGVSGFTSADVGRHIRLLSEPPDWVSATTYTTGNVVKFNGSYWAALTGMTGATPAAGDINPNQPGNLSTSWAPNTSAAVWTWGKVTGVSTVGQISQSLTSTNIGDMTQNGSLAIGFDGNQEQIIAYGLSKTVNTGSTAYIGRDFSSPGAQSVSSARIYPTLASGTTKGGLFWRIASTSSNRATFDFTLYGKSTTPSNATDGTALGTTRVTTAYGIPYTLPITILSSDPTTTYNFLWVTTSVTSAYSEGRIGFSEVEFFSSGGVAGSGATVQIFGDPLFYTSVMKTWRLGLFGGSGSLWPSNGTYHEGRLWLSGAVENRFDASKSNDPFNFEPTGSDGTVAGNNAISYTLNDASENHIQWMRSSEGIILGTSGGQWIIRATTAHSPLTPTSIQAFPINGSSASAAVPIFAGVPAIYIEKNKRKLMELLPDASAGRYVPSNLSEFAKHLTKGGVEEIVYQEEIAPIIWARTADGTLAGATYRRKNLSSEKPPEALGWHRHTLGSGRTVESICSGPSPTGISSLWVVTNNANSGIRHIEVLTDIDEEDVNPMLTWYLDDAIVPSAGTSDTTEITLYGLTHLEGETVDVWAAGIDAGSFVVTGGAVTVPYAGIFTKRALTQLAALGTSLGDLSVPIDAGDTFTIPIVVGHSYTSQGQLLRPVAPDATGASTGPALGKTRRIHQYSALLLDTQGISFGTNFTNIRPALFKTPGGTAYSNTQLFSGVIEGTLDDDYSYDGQLCWEISRPYPATVLALGFFIQTQDR